MGSGALKSNQRGETQGLSACFDGKRKTEVSETMGKCGEPEQLAKARDGSIRVRVERGGRRLGEKKR